MFYLIYVSLFLLQRTIYAQKCTEDSSKQPRCENRGKCMIGGKNYITLPEPLYSALPSAPFFQETKYNDMHCECNGETGVNSLTPGDSGHTGLYCQIEYEVCGDYSVCYHGSRCVPDSNNETHFLCDCPFAYTADAWYAGVGCEYEGTSYCGDDIDDRSEHTFYFLWFCTNGGSCHQYEEDVGERCTCPSGFHGPHCEYLTAIAESDPDEPDVDQFCSLHCENGGQCLFRIHDYGPLLVAFKDETSIVGMYCECPNGFSGVLCNNLNDATHMHDRASSSLKTGDILNPLCLIAVIWFNVYFQ